MLLAHAADFHHQDGRVRRHFEAGHLRDFGGRLADALRIDGPSSGVISSLAERVGLLVVAEVRLVAPSAAPRMRSRSDSSATMACSLEQTVP